MGERNRTPIALEHRPPCLQREWFGAIRLAAAWIPRARMVEGGGEVGFGRHDNILTFA